MFDSLSVGGPILWRWCFRFHSCTQSSAYTLRLRQSLPRLRSERVPGLGTASPPCFVWDPGAAWIQGGAFSLTDVRAYFEDGDATVQTAERRLPWFWFDEVERVLYVDAAR